MTEILRQTTISEIMLLFVLVFVIPMTAMLLLRLRRYEQMYGNLPKGGGKRSKTDALLEITTLPSAAPEKPKVPDNVYPYKKRAFLSPPEKACLAALQSALGAEVHIFPKVALQETVEPTDKNPGYAERLRGLTLDFLVCDVKTGQPFTAVMFEGGKGRPKGPLDEVKKVYAASGSNVVFIEQAENYDAKTLKAKLGIPDLEL